MNSHYEIIFDKINIIEKIQEYNIQTGGYDEMPQNQIINLWQNPDYNEQFINFYSLVNKYLRRIEITIKDEWLVGLKLNSKKDFYDFMIYYINKLTNIIYKNISIKTEIFYRGEYRKSFNYKKGDVLFYSTFQSVTKSISTAFKFAQSTPPDIKILFVIEIPKGFHYKILSTRLKTYDYKQKITYMTDEKEYIVMPNTYYIIVDKFQIYNNVNVIKINLYHQEYYQIENEELYKPKIENQNSYKIKNFNCGELNKFIKKNVKYQKMILILNSMPDYKINKLFYKELNDYNNSNIFNLDMSLINQLITYTNESNIKNNAEEIKVLGLGYYDYQLKNVSKYKKRILRVNILLNTDFKIIKNLTVYAGYYNINDSFKNPDFIEWIKNKKINEEFDYSQILITHLVADKFLYNDIYNGDYPHQKIKKINNTKIMYYKYVVKFYLTNIKICICSTHNFEKDNNIILIPNYKMKIIEKNKKLNKFDLSYIEYKIHLST
jgi:hypothetical protein